jgi:hypothetical protein
VHVVDAEEQILERVEPVGPDELGDEEVLCEVVLVDERSIDAARVGGRPGVDRIAQVLAADRDERRARGTDLHHLELLLLRHDLAPLQLRGRERLVDRSAGCCGGRERVRRTAKRARTHRELGSRRRDHTRTDAREHPSRRHWPATTTTATTRAVGIVVARTLGIIVVAGSVRVVVIWTFGVVVRGIVGVTRAVGLAGVLARPAPRADAREREREQPRVYGAGKVELRTSRHEGSLSRGAASFAHAQQMIVVLIII